MSGDNVKVKVGGDISEANAALDAADRKAEETGRSMREKFGIQGLKGGPKLKRQLDGIFKDAKNAGSGFDLAGDALQRLAGSFRMALPLMVAFTVGVQVFSAIKGSIDKANETAKELRDSLDKLKQIDVDTASIDELQKAMKDAQKAIDDAQAKHGFLWAILHGRDEEGIVSEAIDQAKRLSDAAAAAIDKQTKQMRDKAAGYSEDDDADAIKAKYEKQIADLTQSGRKTIKHKAAYDSESGNEISSESVEEVQTNADIIASLHRQMEEKITEIHQRASDKRSKIDQETADKVAKLNEQAAEERERREEAEMTKPDRLKHLQDKIDESKSATLAAADPVEFAKHQLETEKLITEEHRLQLEISKEAAEEIAKAAEVEKKAQEEAAKEAERAAKERAKQIEEEEKTRIEEANALAKSIKDAEKDLNAPSKLNLTEREWRQRQASHGGLVFSAGAFGQGLAERAAGAGAHDGLEAARQQRAEQLNQLQAMKGQLEILNQKLMGVS
ncbi:hypothetical protein SAMN05444156_3221 [Verrucomicrobium sp. GAS474]|uniref:hypothetical protein n=1 Tax=Verrucomicrobium sp. GAS474 TaxID=1882831 RepID=UPI00087DF3D1|nr:hypothetical protein [Verrucomicrobium sp. GAS474]SDU31106.1 hypothetical protein SAMN05444156_3221 [Verrucomicrobium sp. GAS474]